MYEGEGQRSSKHFLLSSPPSVVICVGCDGGGEDGSSPTRFLTLGHYSCLFFLRYWERFWLLKARRQLSVLWLLSCEVRNSECCQVISSVWFDTHYFVVLKTFDNVCSVLICQCYFILSSMFISRLVCSVLISLCCFPSSIECFLYVDAKFDLKTFVVNLSLYQKKITIPEYFCVSPYRARSNMKFHFVKPILLYERFLKSTSSGYILRVCVLFE